MKKQSAMMQLKDKLQLEIENITKCINQDEYLNGYKTAFENIVKDIDAQMLEMERQNIIDAYSSYAKGGNMDEFYIIYNADILHKKKMKAEAVQLASMCVRFIQECC